VQPWQQNLLGVTASFCLRASVERLAGFDCGFNRSMKKKTDCPLRFSE
jgi:hypothetical protein